jgi:ABC-2 type transport system ATP-binding protein
VNEAGFTAVLPGLFKNAYGAGKTTTVEVLEGFRRPSAGQVRVLGASPFHADRRWRARTGMVLQTWRDHGRWRVREFLAYQASYYRPYATAQTPRPWDAGDLLAAVGLAGQARTRIRQLSGGQRHRLDLAIGVAGRPELLFLDEPTAGHLRHLLPDHRPARLAPGNR